MREDFFIGDSFRKKISIIIIDDALKFLQYEFDEEMIKIALRCKRDKNVFLYPFLKKGKLKK